MNMKKDTGSDIRQGKVVDKCFGRFDVEMEENFQANAKIYYQIDVWIW